MERTKNTHEDCIETVLGFAEKLYLNEAKEAMRCIVVVI
jgi:hypothetical protein